jgi:hypothetical protein
MESKMILIDVEKFKELLIYGWHLLPLDKQRELLEMGIYPRKMTP